MVVLNVEEVVVHGRLMFSYSPMVRQSRAIRRYFW
jgi:hypothetical protein